MLTQKRPTPESKVPSNNVTLFLSNNTKDKGFNGQYV